MKRALLSILSGATGAALVLAAFRLSFLNWVVDGPGWLVSRFTSIDFHEGEGAFGFFLAIFLAWLFWSAVIFLLAVLVQSKSKRGRDGTLGHSSNK